jgi:hypothetical protein
MYMPQKGKKRTSSSEMAGPAHLSIFTEFCGENEVHEAEKQKPFG